MTPSQRKKTRRNIKLIKDYHTQKPIKDLLAHYGITRGRLYQILAENKDSPNRLPHRTNRDHFLGVEISESVKKALRRKARQEKISVSLLVSDILETVLSAVKYDKTDK